MQIILNVDADSENLYNQVVEAAHQYLKDENRLANIRQYIEALKHTEFVFNEEITKVCHTCLTFDVNMYVYLINFVFFYIFNYYFYMCSDYSRRFCKDAQCGQKYRCR